VGGGWGRLAEAADGEIVRRVGLGFRSHEAIGAAPDSEERQHQEECTQEKAEPGTVASGTFQRANFL
jgi:hypothetical protein